MGKRVVIGGLLGLLGACGGRTDGSESAPIASPAREPEQGLYLAPGGGPEHVADDLGSPNALAMTADRVVFTTRRARLGGEEVDAGALYVADKRVGLAQLLAVDRQGASYDALTTDETTAFLATSDARLLRIAVSGGETTTIATLPAPAVALAATGDRMYVAMNDGGVLRVAKTGGEVEPLASVTGPIRALQADDVAVYVATGAAEGAPAGIVRVPLDGSAAKVFASGGEPCAMVLRGRKLFWTELATNASEDPRAPASGEVLQLSLDGGDVSTVASGAFSACAIAADHDDLFFATTLRDVRDVRSSGRSSTSGGGLGLMRTPIAGGEPVAVAQAARALTQPGAVAADDTYVYWLTETAVLRLRKETRTAP